MKKYIALDSNIYVSFFETGFKIADEKGFKEPEELKVLGDFLNALNKTDIELILPEVVILECERIKEEKKKNLQTLYKNTLKNIQDSVIPPNKKISDSSMTKIKDTMEKEVAAEVLNIDSAWKVFENICKSKNTKIVKLSESIFLKAYIRGLMGKKPYTAKQTGKDSDTNNKPIHDIQPDCIITESIIDFLKDKEDYELCLSTNDSNFFSSLTKNEIDPQLKEELKISKHYLSLGSLISQELGIKIEEKKIEVKQNLDAFPFHEKSPTVEGDELDSLSIVKGEPVS